MIKFQEWYSLFGANNEILVYPTMNFNESVLLDTSEPLTVLLIEEIEDNQGWTWWKILSPIGMVWLFLYETVVTVKTSGQIIVSEREVFAKGALVRELELFRFVPLV